MLPEKEPKWSSGAKDGKAPCDSSRELSSGDDDDLKINLDIQSFAKFPGKLKASGKKQNQSLDVTPEKILKFVRVSRSVNSTIGQYGGM